MEQDVIITGFSKPTNEGIILHLNRPTCLKTGMGAFKEFWVSWDKVGEALFDDYAESVEKDERKFLASKYDSPASK